jgi:hypothetical protein
MDCLILPIFIKATFKAFHTWGNYNILGHFGIVDSSCPQYSDWRSFVWYLFCLFFWTISHCAFWSMWRLIYSLYIDYGLIKNKYNHLCIYFLIIAKFALYKKTLTNNADSTVYCVLVTLCKNKSWWKRCHLKASKYTGVVLMNHELPSGTTTAWSSYKVIS